ncbi:MAG: signal recognition particle protein [Thermoanaerobaculia bacterium]
MFEGLQDKFQDVFRRLRGEGRITGDHLAAALKQIRLALLEADVHFKVVKEFLARVEEKALGEKVLESLSPAQQVIAIVRDELTATLGGEDARELKLDGAPAVILMCGLQGSGKTTTCGKLAKRLAARGRYPLLVAADLQRAAAVEQLVQVGARVDVPVLQPQAGELVVDLCKRALREARERGRDVVILDTAGRLHVDADLMAEIAKIATAVDPDEILYVADAMTGQDAVRSAQEFARVLPLTGVLLSKLDGDARGGAALSVRAVAQVPIRFVGVGEKAEDLELFSPARMASRILGMGDVLALIERAQETVDAKEAERLAERLSRNEFTLEDLRDQLRQVKKLGSLKSVLGMLPKMGALKGLSDVGEADEKRLARTEAIINSMTLEERRNPGLLQASRKRRVARGSGTSVQEINQLIRQYLQMKKMMKGVKSGWMQRAFGKGAMPTLPGGKGGASRGLGGVRGGRFPGM